MKKLWVVFLCFVALAAQAEDEADQAEEKRTTQFEELQASLKRSEIEGQKIKDLLIRYSDGFKSQNKNQILSCLAPSFFKITTVEGDPPSEWRPDFFHAGDSAIEEWLDAYLKVSVPYENDILFRGIKGGTHDLALIFTEETGRRGPVVWEGITNVWILGKVNGEWRIQGILAELPEGWEKTLGYYYGKHHSEKAIIAK